MVESSCQLHISEGNLMPLMGAAYAWYVASVYVLLAVANYWLWSPGGRLKTEVTVHVY